MAPLDAPGACTDDASMTDRRTLRRVLLPFGLLLLGALALRIPAIRADFALDDFAQLAMSDGRWPVPHAPWDLYAFARSDPAEHRLLVDRGLLPWWTSEHFRFAMFRPLTSVTLAIDHAAFGMRPLPGHIVSAAWFAASLAAALFFLRGLLPAGAAFIALGLYAIDESHTFPIAWLANRSPLVSSFFALLALTVHHRARVSESRRDRTLSWIAWSLAFAGGEYAFAWAAYVPAYELCLVRSPWRDRLRAMLPLALVACGYLFLQRALGCGASASALYVDPLNDPWGFVRALGQRLPLLSSELLAARPIDAPSVFAHLGAPWHASALAIAALGGLGAVAWAKLDASTRRTVAFFASGSALALVPVCASIPSGRLLAASAFGLSGVLGIFAGALISPWRRDARTLALAAGVALFAVPHVVFAGTRVWVEGSFVRVVSRGMLRAIRQSPVATRDLGRSQVFLLAASDPQTMHYPSLVWRLDGRPLARGWHVLAMPRTPFVAARTGDDRSELISAHSLIDQGAAQFFIDPAAPLRAGQEVDLEGMIVTVVRAGPSGPTHIRIRFDRSLDDPSLRLYVATPNSLRPLQAAPVGAIGAVAVAPVPFAP